MQTLSARKIMTTIILDREGGWFFLGHGSSINPKKYCETLKKTTGLYKTIA